MKVKDIFAVMLDNYKPVIVEIIGKNKIEAKYIVEPHATDYANIPRDVWSMDVFALMVYFDNLVITVKGVEDGIDGGVRK